MLKNLFDNISEDEINNAVVVKEKDSYDSDPYYLLISENGEFIYHFQFIGIKSKDPHIYHVDDDSKWFDNAIDCDFYCRSAVEGEYHPTDDYQILYRELITIQVNLRDLVRRQLNPQNAVMLTEFKEFNNLSDHTRAMLCIRYEWFRNTWFDN